MKREAGPRTPAAQERAAANEVDGATGIKKGCFVSPWITFWERLRFAADLCRDYRDAIPQSTIRPHEYTNKN